MLKTIVKKGSYHDSVVLMLLTNQISALEGVKKASIMMATPANKDIFKQSGLDTQELMEATANDMVVVADVEDDSLLDQIMETAEVIFKFIIVSLNAYALMFTLILVSKWHRRMEDKLDKIEGYVRHVSDRNDIVYINQLSELQRLLIKEERYEEADNIGKINKDEEIKLGLRE